MRKLFVDGHGVLGQEDGVIQRQRLNLDQRDFDVDPITIIFNQNITGLSQKFCVEFLKASVYRVLDGLVPHSNITPWQLNNDLGRDAMALGPYTYAPEGLPTNDYARVRHRLYGGIVALYGFWEYEREKGRDLLAESMADLTIK